MPDIDPVDRRLPELRRPPHPHLRGRGFTPDIRHSTDDCVVIQNLVARKLGVALLPRLALDAFRHPDVQVLPLGTTDRALYLLCHREALQIPAITQVTRALQQAATAR